MGGSSLFLKQPPLLHNIGDEKDEKMVRVLSVKEKRRIIRIPILCKFSLARNII